MDLDTQVDTYFANSERDVRAGTGEAAPVSTTEGNTVTALIDGRQYFGEIRALLEGMGSGDVARQFFYMTGWRLHMSDGPGRAETGMFSAAGRPVSPTTRVGQPLDVDPPFELEDTAQGPHPVMGQLLAQRAFDRVDVRVMGWVNPFMLMGIADQHVPPGFWNAAAGTVKSIEWLRAQRVGNHNPLAQRVCGLTVGHNFGAFHLKMVVAHNGDEALAFIGGIDFVKNRAAGEMHLQSDTWHDAAVKVTGPAVRACYMLFKQLWDEQLSRSRADHFSGFLYDGRLVPAVAPGTSSVPPLTGARGRDVPNSGSGPHWVQVARTLPQFPNRQDPRDPRHADLVGGPLSFASREGAFEVMVALRRAIAAATTYVYIEDISFFSSDVMDWLNLKLKEVESTVTVILLSGQPDPDDPPTQQYTIEAINRHLLFDLNENQLDRVRLFERTGVTVHSKLTIVDDRWLFVGSANCTRRSLFTDGELSVGVLGPDVADLQNPENSLAKQVRINLWGGHFGKAPLSNGRLQLTDLTAALAVWEPEWEKAGHPRPYDRPASLEKRPWPLPDTAAHFIEEAYDRYDYDSRDPLPLPALQ